MVTYDEFLKAVQDNITKYLPGGFENASVTIKDTLKNNGLLLQGLTVIKEGSIISPTMYLNDYYDLYCKTDSMDIVDIIEKISVDFSKHLTMMPSIDIERIYHYDSIKDKLQCKLVNTLENEVFLKNVPHTEVEDLSIVYFIDAISLPNGTGTITIKNQMLEHYGVSLSQLHQDAMKNVKETAAPIVSFSDQAKEIIIPNIMEMEEIGYEEALREFEEQLVTPSQLGMYIITNQTNTNGAIQILNPDIQEALVQKLGGDFYIFPFSVHEVLVISTECITSKELEDMLKDVNQTQLLPEEILSDHVYQFDVKEHTLQLCDLEKEHQLEEAKPCKRKQY